MCKPANVPLNELGVMTLSKPGKCKKRHGNYNKRATAKQTAAQKHNFAIFRLRGIESSLTSIANELGDEAKSALCGAHCYVREALMAETGK